MLRDRRLACGLSQRKLAALAHVRQPDVSRYEAGKTEPMLGVALALARALGCTVEDLWPASPKHPKRAPTTVPTTSAQTGPLSPAQASAK